jgi:hypothetical protein
METTVPPSSSHVEDQRMTKGPWRILRNAVPGGFSKAGLQLILAWIAFDALSGAAWALHLKELAKWSALPNYWGELLTARDVWELWANGGLSQDPIGHWAKIIGFLSLVWMLWASWRVQTRAVNLPARLAPWLCGLVETLLIGIPILILGYGVSWVMEGVASMGIHGLGWLNLVGGTLFKLACVSTVMLQWWLCRIDRAGLGQENWYLGSPEILLRHLYQSFRRLWAYPVQWGTFILGGVVVRVGLHFLVFLFAWKLGGGSSFRVWSFLILQIVVAAFNAWLLGWFLRLSALYWHHDAKARNEIPVLENELEGETEQGLA